MRCPSRGSKAPNPEHHLWNRGIMNARPASDIWRSDELYTNGYHVRHGYLMTGSQ